MGEGLAQNKALLNKDVLGIVKLAFFGNTECKTYIKSFFIVPYILVNRHSGSADVISNVAI